MYAIRSYYGRTRTLNRSFWRRVLYQLGYWPRYGWNNSTLLGLAMQRMLTATRTIFIELKPGISFAALCRRDLTDSVAAAKKGSRLHDDRS